MQNGISRLTIAMPVYNAMPYLRSAIASILEQSFKEFSLVAVDDGSTDGSLAYLHSITDPRLTVVQVARRQGQGAARNAVLRNCSTEYVAFADADDISLPTRLERQVSYLDSHPEIGMLGARVAYIATSGRTGFPPPLAMDHTAIRRDLLAGRHAVANCTLAFRTRMFERTGVFRISGAGEDWDLFLRMTEETIVANLPDILCHYRLHSGSTNAQQVRVMRLRYAHACECARRRENKLLEDSFEDFCDRQAKRPLWMFYMDRLDELSASHYRMAIVDILEEKTFKGYSRLALAASLSPLRLAQRFSRKVRSAFKDGRATEGESGILRSEI